MLLKDFLNGASLDDLKTVSQSKLDVPDLLLKQEVAPLPACPKAPDIAKALKKDTGLHRVPWYLGPDLEVKPETLEKFEKQGGWIIEPKHDGMWAMLTVGNPAKGLPHSLKSRDAKTGLVGGANTGDLLMMPLPLVEGTVLVGELEAATEASTKLYLKHGFRRLNLFDFPQGAQDHRSLVWKDRRTLLENIHGEFDALCASRFPLVPYFTDKFRQRYDEWLEQGFEGCVLKRADSKYFTPRVDGKTDLWHRCKKRLTEDYVLCGIGKTPGGAPAGLWGLFKNGKLTQVFQKNCPDNLLQEKYVGKVVCEFMGWERFASGALRHAQFVRVRPDKTPEMCVWKEPT
jgi:ATP-dependent DNA ligase